MRKFLRTILELLAVLLLVSFGTFMLVSLLPNDPAVIILGEGHPPEAYEAKRQELGLNDPLFSRYADWLGSALQGDLGKSYITLHDEDIIHPLKEVDAEAQAWCTTTDQVVQTLKYVLRA